MDARWPGLVVRFQAWTGMRVPDAMRPTALRVLDQLAMDAGIDADAAPDTLLRRLDRDRELRQRILDAIGLGTTWFNREEAGVAALVTHLAEVMPRGQQATIWSAGCSSGEEPYTIAMALLEAGLGGQILATDLNRRALRRGFDGIYSDRSVARLPASWRARYTEDYQPGTVRIVERIRRMVTFELHNFRNQVHLPAGWGRFDAVVCRNALIYFERAEALAIIERLAAVCLRGGYLLLSAVERPLFWLSSLAAESETAALVQIPPPGATLPVLQSSTGKRAQTDVRINRRVERAGEYSPSVARGSGPAQPFVDTVAKVVADLLARANAAERRGALEDAFALLDQAAATAPLSAPAHLARGLVCKRLAQTQDAITSLRTACFLDADAWMAPYQLAQCLELMNQAAEAQSAYRHALDVLEAGGPSGQVSAVGQPEILAATVAEQCRKRLGIVPSSESEDGARADTSPAGMSER